MNNKDIKELRDKAKELKIENEKLKKENKELQKQMENFTELYMMFVNKKEQMKDTEKELYELADKIQWLMRHNKTWHGYKGTSGIDKPHEERYEHSFKKREDVIFNRLKN